MPIFIHSSNLFSKNSTCLPVFHFCMILIQVLFHCSGSVQDSNLQGLIQCVLPIGASTSTCSHSSKFKMRNVKYNENAYQVVWPFIGKREEGERSYLSHKIPASCLGNLGFNSRLEVWRDVFLNKPILKCFCCGEHFHFSRCMINKSVQGNM